MSERDFYEVLGVARDATAEQIRRAYRERARALHPDVNKAPDAQSRFAELQNAYETLSDEKKRQLYDRFGHARGPQDRDAWASQVSQAGFDLDSDQLDDLFEVFFGGRGGPFARHGAARGDGRGARPAGARPRRGSDQSTEITISFQTAALGGRESLRQDAGRTIELTIPAGVDHGARLRVAGAGEPGAAGGAPGDLLVTVRVGGHPLFRRGEGEHTGKGLDLTLALPLTIAEAALGAVVEVPTLTGSAGVTIPPSTPSGRKLRLKGRGIRAADGRSGDLLCEIRIVPPPPGSISAEEATVLQRIGERTPVRHGEGWPGAPTRA